MEFDFFSEPVTFCVIRNYYTKDEAEHVLKALEEMKSELMTPENTGAARGLDGAVRKNNKGIFIENQGHVINHLNKKLYGEVAWELCKNNWFYSYLKQDVYDKTLVSYYEHGSYYKPHKDRSLLTAIYYTWREPKTFEGGDLYFGDFKVPIENNCLVVFPSPTEHEVKNVQGEGRWAISQFVNIRADDKLIYHFPNCMEIQDFKRIEEVTRNGHWTYQGRSVSGPTRFWHLELENDKYFTHYLKGCIENVTKRKFSHLYRVYANGQAHGQDGDFHQDDKNPKAWTFILYLNVIDHDVIEKWGGVTEFKMPDGLMTQLPHTNMGILFRSDIWHRGMAPSRHVDDLRITIAWKLIE